MDRPREAQHLPVRVGDFGILHEEAPPEAATQQAGQPLAVGQPADLDLRRLQRARGLGRQRPLPHLTVRGRRQIDAPARRKALDDIGERRQLEPARGQEPVEEAVEPSALVHVGVGARPDPELLAVVDHGDRRGASPPGLQILERLVDAGEGDQVPQPLVDREDAEAQALLVRQVVTAEGVDVEARQREVPVVDEHVLDAGLAQHPRQVRLPDALGEPHAAGSHAEVRLEERRPRRSGAPPARARRRSRGDRRCGAIARAATRAGCRCSARSAGPPAAPRAARGTVGRRAPSPRA